MPDAKGLVYDVVDVFAEERLQGNPLAVVRGGARLETAALQAIARELNLSETAFVLHDSARDGAFDVRIFTPGKELPYAGHPTLGTAWVIRQTLLDGHADELVLRLGVGPVRVRFAADGLVWLTTPRASFAPAPDRGAIAAALGVPLDALHATLPIEVATTGHHQLLVPLRDLEALRACRIESGAYERLRASGAPDSYYPFALGARDPRNQLSVRLFAPAAGVPEDPATGSAAGWLGSYLSRHRVLGAGDFDVRIEQGHEISRPSLLHVRARGAGDALEVSVGGRVIPAARGELLQ
ncbi:MAG: PhzF family phenazine biosynthesis protein [Myxococcota bacterium]